MRATATRRTNRRASHPVTVLSSYGPAVAGGAFVAAALGMRAGLATLVAGLAVPIYYKLAPSHGLKAVPSGRHEAETADSLATLAASNTRATLARLPSDFTVFDDLKFASVSVDHVVVGPSGVWAMETQANPGFVQERGGSVWLDGAPMGKDPRRQARAGAAAVAELLERETGERWWVEGLVCFPNATVAVSGNLPVPRVVSADQLLSRLHLAPAPLCAEEQARLVHALEHAKEQMALRRIAELTRAA